MKSILLDPVKQKIVPFQLSVKKGLSQAYEVKRCLNTMNLALALCRN